MSPLAVSGSKEPAILVLWQRALRERARSVVRAPRAGRGELPGKRQRLFRRSRRKKFRIRRTGYLEEESPLVYKPQPIDTSGVQLDEEILQLTERLAENAHDIWAQ